MMATVAATAADRLQCGVCCERFDEGARCPRLLGCGHTFCTHCLERLPRDQPAAKAKARAKAAAATISCPSCREPTALPAAGVAALPKNFIVLDTFVAVAGGVAAGGAAAAGDKSVAAAAGPVCELGCVEGDHRATHHCTDCGEVPLPTPRVPPAGRTSY